MSFPIDEIFKVSHWLSIFPNQLTSAWYLILEVQNLPGIAKDSAAVHVDQPISRIPGPKASRGQEEFLTHELNNTPTK